MSVIDRSFTDVLRDVVRNVQEILRSEFRLAKAEIVEEAAKAKSSALFLTAGAVITLFGLLFLLLAVVSALALVMPVWAAALIPGAVLALVGSVTLVAGIRRFKQLHTPIDRTVESLKENVEWARQLSK